MFLNYLKDFIVKKTLKKNLKNLENNFSVNAIQKIGLLIDATTFTETEQLIKELISIGFARDNIQTIVYADKVKKSEAGSNFTFNANSIKWNAEILEQEINSFINLEFDLLISFYDIERAILLKITHDSKAHFKVGFSSIDKRLNHFIINSSTDNHAVFVNELFKYLKLLNKI